jgi:hypothetical protein
VLWALPPASRLAALRARRRRAAHIAPRES